MDGSHMIGTAIDSSDEEIDFAEVHDEYWCHASDMDRMNVILRQQFVEIYSVDRLMALYNEWSERYEGLPLPPTRGSLDINAVLESKYFFS
jgi:DNA-directed RNA polymerase